MGARLQLPSHRAVRLLTVQQQRRVHQRQGQSARHFHPSQHAGKSVGSGGTSRRSMFRPVSLRRSIAREFATRQVAIEQEGQSSSLDMPLRKTEPAGARPPAPVSKRIQRRRPEPTSRPRPNTISDGLGWHSLDVVKPVEERMCCGQRSGGSKLCGGACNHHGSTHPAPGNIFHVAQ